MTRDFSMKSTPVNAVNALAPDYARAHARVTRSSRGPNTAFTDIVFTEVFRPFPYTLRSLIGHGRAFGQGAWENPEGL